MPTPPAVHAFTPRGSPVVAPTAPPSDLRDQVERALPGQYELGEEIGRGGMGVVYRARDRRLDREVAIKVLPPELAYDPGIRTRFTGEARTAAQLSHPHIVSIYDVGEQDGVAFLVMALVAGDNLAALLARDPRPPIGEARRILCEIADALAYAHRRGVVHRDVKPDNILLDAESGRAIVTDFGIARAMEAGMRLTVTGMTVGTPTYMSPEQAVGERELDGRSDVYALGVLAYQLLTGRVPFAAGNPMALLMKHVNEAPRPIAELRPEAPPALCQAIERALAKSPDDRWPNAAAFRDAIERDEATPVWRDAEKALPARVERPASRVPAEPPKAPAPPNLLACTPEQRDDLRLWSGRLDLLDRVKAFRRYIVGTVGMSFVGLVGFALAVGDGVVPLVVLPAVPMWMSYKLWRRGRSLRGDGVKVHWAVFMPLARWALPGPADAKGLSLARVAPPEVLEGPHGALVRRAAEDRVAILDVVRQLPEADRALIADVGPTANALVERIVAMAQALVRLERSIDPAFEDEIAERLAAAEADAGSPDGERRLALLRRQRDSFRSLLDRRVALTSQLESAGLVLGGLRLDLLKLGSSGQPSAIAEVSSATQEARALSRDIGAMLDAAAEVKRL